MKADTRDIKMLFDAFHETSQYYTVTLQDAETKGSLTKRNLFLGSIPDSSLDNPIHNLQFMLI